MEALTRHDYSRLAVPIPGLPTDQSYAIPSQSSPSSSPAVIGQRRHDVALDVVPSKQPALSILANEELGERGPEVLVEDCVYDGVEEAVEVAQP